MSTFDFLKMMNVKDINLIQPSTAEVWPYALVAFLIPIEATALGNVGFTIWGASILYFFIRDKRKFFKVDEIDYLLCLAPFLLYTLVAAGLAMCDTEECKKITLSFLERQLLFALYPLLLLLIPKFSKRDFELIMNWFCLSQVIQLAIILLLPNYEAVHHPYLGMYAAFSMAYCLRLFSLNKSIFHLLLAVCLFALIVVIKAKTALFTVFLATSIIFFIYRRTYLIIAVIVAGVGAALFLMKMSATFSAPITEYLNSIVYIKTYSWKCSWQAFVQSHQYGLGVGVGNSWNALKDVYDTYYDWVGYMGYNTHNQYMETLLANGIAGLGLLLIWLSRLIMVAAKQKKKLLGFFITVFMIACITESILWRQKGIVFLVFFSILLVKYKDNE